MDERDEFGEVRSLLHRPSESNWRRILELCARCPTEEYQQRWLPYLRHHLDAWPLRLRSFPPEKLRPLLDGAQVELFGIVRCLSLANVGLDAVQLSRLLEQPELEQLELLDLSYNRLTTRCIELLAGSSALRMLQVLELESCEIRALDLPELLEGEGLRGLHSLSLKNNTLGEAGAEALAGGRWPDELASLDLSFNKLGPEGLDALVGTSARRLERLSLGWNELGDQALQSWIDRTNWEVSHQLELAGNDLTGEAMDALASSELMIPRGLKLQQNRLGDEGVAALVRRPWARGLRRLDLQRNQIEDDGLVVLAESPYLDSLEELILWGNPFGERGERALAESPYLPEALRAQWRVRLGG